ncbi:hypothetical protein [Candidatus Solirubrobacter pratensis]|uniref:hypothetical protein n=1 Tax=Candidatus Solirubrobacter pratensis TaxID=1298857 RepID=UPI00041117C1|nr:hypothetical protein [Candidatus Solirubrobacter pratensis]
MTVDVPELGRSIAEEAAAANIALRLIGGVAVWVRCPSARTVPLARAYGDIDLIGRARDRKAIVAFLEARGYEPDRMFNALHGASRLNFRDPRRDLPVDVLLDRFAMAHALDLRDRLTLDAPTLPLADLLLTKLQVVSINAKDLRDICALLLDHDLDASGIDLARILEVTRADWGFEHTIHRTIATLTERIGDFDLERAAAERIVTRAEAISAALHAAPKSAKWKMRARVGERARWYEEPEEARG